MNGQLELRIITQPYSAVYWGYFRRLFFGNSLTKHIKLSSFSYFVVIVFLPISHIPPCFHANPPDFSRLIGPRGLHSKCMIFVDLTMIEYMYLILFANSLICKRRKSSGYNSQ